MRLIADRCGGKIRLGVGNVRQNGKPREKKLPHNYQVKVDL